MKALDKANVVVPIKKFWKFNWVQKWDFFTNNCQITPKCFR